MDAPPGHVDTGNRALAPGSQAQVRGVLERQHFQLLLDALTARGYQVIGPTVRAGAIVYDELKSVEDLPAGWGDEQSGGTYRLQKLPAPALFGCVVGPSTWKAFLHPPVTRLWRARRGEDGPVAVSGNGVPPKRAFLGVRSCELHAMAAQDQVFLRGGFVDPVYRERREGILVVAVHCGRAGGTCFCVSMNTGPRAAFGFDLALTEVCEANRHCFVIEAATERGQEILGHLPCKPVGKAEEAAAARVVADAASHMGRKLETGGLKELLYRNFEHPRWDDVGARCLTCANCTLVCPTCFCTTVEDVTDLTGEHAERWRKWDSCFTMDFSFIHGGSVRASSKSRYRQWLTHKLASWYDQFGQSGCVGCGRCITWCPVGIDLTEEARAIRQSDGATMAKE